MSRVEPQPDYLTIVDTLRHQAAIRPDARAFLFLERGEREAGTLSYGALDRRARTIAWRLKARGLTGKSAVLAYPSGLEFIAALFGCFYAGVVASPSPVLPGPRAFERADAVARDAGAACILTLAQLLSGKSEQASGISFITTDEIADADGPPPDEPDPQSLALLQYTSGSTGLPRGVMLTQANIIHNQRVLARALHMGPDDVGICWLPMYHDMGLIGALLHSIYVGGFSVLMPPLSFLQRPMRWLEAIDKYRGTISMAPCFAYDLCARRAANAQDRMLDLSSWRVAICGGEPVRPSVMERFAEAFRHAGFRDTAILPAYGLAETTLLAAAPETGNRLITRSAAGYLSQQKRLVCCGQAREGQRIAIVDPETKRRLPDGELGEIWIQGPSIAKGYWNRRQENEELFHAMLIGEEDQGQWLRTGDLGLLAPEGLYVTGRRKELIIVRGVNHDPLALEMAAGESHPALAQGAGGAFSLERQDGEVVVLVYEVGRAALKNLDAPGITASVAEAMSHNFGLALYDLVLLRPGTLPRTTSGKVQRLTCREQYLAGQLASVAAIEHPALGRCRPQRSGSVL